MGALDAITKAAQGLAEAVETAGEAGIGKVEVPSFATESDATFFSNLTETKPSPLVGEITEHLKEDGRPGAAAFTEVFADSKMLDAQFSTLEADGVLDPALLEAEGMPLMIDLEATTPEMIAEGRAVLLEDAREEMLGHMNLLAREIDMHISRTAETTAEAYADYFAQDLNLAKTIKLRLGGELKAPDMPFKPNIAESERFDEMLGDRYTSKEEMHATFRRFIRDMVRNRPESVGLGASDSIAREFKNGYGGIGGQHGPEGIQLDSLRRLHEFMRGHAENELGISGAFGDSIEQSVNAAMAKEEVIVASNGPMPTIPEFKPQLEEGISSSQPQLKAGDKPVNENQQQETPHQNTENKSADTAEGDGDTDERSEDSSEPAEEGEVVYHQGEWFTDDIDPKTQEWLRQKGYEDVAQEFTEEERERARRVNEEFGRNFNEARARAEQQPGVKEILNEVFDGEGDQSEEAREAAKLIMRIAVKVSIQVAKSIAKNIAKDKDTPQGVKVFFGVVADGLDGIEDFADHLIAGDMSSDLQKDIFDFVTDKFN